MSQRGLGKGGRPLPLPVVDIESASDMFLVDPYEKPAFLRFLIEMDRTYIEVRSEQITKQEKHAAGRKKGR